MNRTERYREEKKRLATIFPEYSKVRLAPPQPLENYRESYRNDQRAGMMWRGRLKAWAHEVDIIRSGGNPSPAGEMAIIDEMGYSPAFSEAAKNARQEASEACLVARHPHCNGYRKLVSQGIDPQTEADRLTALANKFDEMPGPLPYGNLEPPTCKYRSRRAKL